MRDIVWTIIIIWLVWKVYNAFISKAKTQPINQKKYQQKREGEVRIDKNVNQNSHFNPNDGEYVDYEEIK